jgi:putative hydrolase of the HAD superfamily
MAAVKALIFDFDGLIVDTETSIYIAWKELYTSQGQTLSLSDYIRCVGSTFSEYDPMKVLEERCEHEIDWEPLILTKDSRIKELHEGLGPLGGVEELLASAQDHGVPCAVASSSEDHWVEPWLEKIGLRGAFDCIRTRSANLPPKPAPDLFLAAADGLGVAPGEALVFEDSANGLRAALVAGIRCWMVPNPITEQSDFSGADRILGSLTEVNLPELVAAQ